ncbi:MAG TPA: hypothetical protein VEG68_04240 [Terriglobales bacterium]|nr:hypothetical protein [Terriglobales bacterium]
MSFAKHSCEVLLVVVLAAALAAAAAPKVALSPTIGPPTTSISVSGSGFPDSTVVDIYFDTTELVLTVTTATGTFSGVTILLPTSAIPGTH